MEITRIKAVKTDGRFVFRVELNDAGEKRVVDVEASALSTRSAMRRAIVAAVGKYPELPEAWAIFLSRWLGGSSDAWQTKARDIAAGKS